MSDWLEEYARWERDVAEGRAKNSWSPGGTDEPHWAKMRRESRLPNLPDWIPLLCGAAARNWLDIADNAKHIGEVERILYKDSYYQNEVNRSFWRDVEYVLRHSPAQSSNLDFSFDHKVEGFFRWLILWMVARGGKVHLRRDFTDKRKNRSDAAEALKDALHYVRADKGLSQVSIGDLIDVVANRDNLGADAKEMAVASQAALKRFSDPDHPYFTIGMLLAMSGPRLPDLLRALIDALENVWKVTSFDDIDAGDELMRQGRDAAQNQLFETITREFAIYTGKARQELATTAVQIAFGLDGPPNLAGRVRAHRQRQRRARP